jgi:biopolymer transport protein ExbD
MSHGGGGDEDGKLDLVPLIDTVMLLLMFFILTSKFSTEEKAISSLLPTDKGQMASTPSKPVEEPKQVNICIYPAGMQRGFQPSEYRDQLANMRQPGQNVDFATLRVGADTMEVDGRTLSRSLDAAQVNQEISKIHDLIGSALEKYETGAGERKDQHPVIIHCFSGMSWRFALIAYDAVRYYESTKATFKFTGNPEELARMREVTFAPPRIRNYSANELGNELYEIVHMK